MKASKLFDLTGKVAIVTGASRGLGKAMALGLASAGADVVVSPHFVGGQRMVTSLLKPTFVDFLDRVISVTGMEIDFDEIEISDDSPLVGKAISESRIGQEFNVTILTVRKHDKEYLPKISGQTRLEAGDLLLALGNREQLAALRKIVISQS